MTLKKTHIDNDFSFDTLLKLEHSLRPKLRVLLAIFALLSTLLIIFLSFRADQSYQSVQLVLVPFVVMILPLVIVIDSTILIVAKFNKPLRIFLVKLAS